MHRRTFLKKAAASGLACTCPAIVAAFAPPSFSASELIGKANIALFGAGINLRKAAYTSFIALQKAAAAEGIAVKAVSGYRSFYRQKSIWEQKYKRYTQIEGLQPQAAIDKIIQYSTIPGTSRHHWGTDVDLIDGGVTTSGDVLLPNKYKAGGPFEALKLWLDKHAETFGFYLVYTNNPHRKGFQYEPWHYSYAPLSVPMLTAYRKLNVFQILQDTNFLGSNYFTSDFIETYRQDYILGINPELL